MRSFSPIIAICFLLSAELRGQDVYDRSPLPPNPNSLQEVFGPQAVDEVLDPGMGVQAEILPSIGLTFRASGKAVVDTIYDTGLTSSGPRFLPSTIVIDGTPAARGRGRFQMTGTTSQLRFVVRAAQVFGEPEAAAEVDFVDEDLRLRHAVGDVALADRLVLTGGQTDSTFSDPAARPVSIINDGSPAGAILRRQAQLRLTRVEDNGITYSLAIENPISSDFVLPAPESDVRLQRYPDFIARVRWEGRDIAESFQVATLVRGIGFQDVAETEHFVTGWGVAGTARFRLVPHMSDDNVQLGLVGGQGLGRYLFGFSADELIKTGGDVTAAGPDGAGDLAAAPTLGGYFGYQHFWSPFFASHFGYGFAHADAPIGVPATVSRSTQNAWLNCVYEVTPDFLIGVEYQYGIHEIASGAIGDNHRVQLTLSFGN